MKVLFAPDYRSADPYQGQLSDALEHHGVTVDYLSDYRRGLPLTRSLRQRDYDVLHLHWPEKYFPVFRDGRDPLRLARWPMDLRLARRGRPLVYTAHNLTPHDRKRTPALLRAVRATLHQAAGIIAHTSAAQSSLAETFSLPLGKIHVIAFGDMTISLPPAISRSDARQRLGLNPNTPLCLMPGSVRPYKGVEEILASWDRDWSADLHIVGQPLDDAYAEALTAATRPDSRVHLRLARQSDEALRNWLCAADCVLVNYTTIFSSGVAPLVRSWGLPLLVPKRCDILDLAEPSPRVLRFESAATDLRDMVARALQAPEAPVDLASWRASVAWEPIAARTAALYNAVRGKSSQNSPA